MTVSVGSDIWWDYAAPAAGVVIVLLAVVVFVYGIGFNRKVAEPVFFDLQSPDSGKKQQKKKQKSKSEKKVRKIGIGIFLFYSSLPFITLILVRQV